MMAQHFIFFSRLDPGQQETWIFLSFYIVFEENDTNFLSILELPSDWHRVPPTRLQYLLSVENSDIAPQPDTLQCHESRVPPSRATIDPDDQKRRFIDNGPHVIEPAGDVNESTGKW